MIKNRKILAILKKYQNSREALVLTGFRRVGKTSVMRKIFEELPTNNKIFLDLESPINQKVFQTENYDNIPRTLANLKINFQEKAYIFLDEIQLVKNITSIIKYLYDHYDIKFYLTGSASFYLKNHFSESMAGRKFVFDLFPLDFEEFLWFKEQRVDLCSLREENKSEQSDVLSASYEEYLLYGGFPGVVLQDSAEKKGQELDDILGSYFQLDVQTLAHFRDNQNLKDLLFLLAGRAGQKADVSKLAITLNVSRQTIYQYLDFFQQTYLINFLRPLSGSRDIQLRQIPKIYFIDTGLLNHIGQIGKGQLFENKIYNQLSSALACSGKLSILKENLHYYQTKIGAEIDFILNRETAYEAKLDGNVFDLKKLSRVVEKAKLKDGYIVSLAKSSENEKIIYPYFLDLLHTS